MTLTPDNLVTRTRTRTQITEQGQKHKPGQNTKKKIWIG